MTTHLKTAAVSFAAFSTLLLASGLRAESASADTSSAAAPQAAAAQSESSQSEAEGASAQRMLVMDLRANGVDAATVKTIQALLVEQLSKRSADHVLSGDDVRRVLEVQANKDLLGCTDDGCMAEIAGALGAERVVYGSLGRLGDVFVLQVVLFDAEKVQVIRRANIREAKLDVFPDRLPELVAELLGQSAATTKSSAKSSSTAAQHAGKKGAQSGAAKQVVTTTKQPKAQSGTASPAASWPRYAMYAASGISLLTALGAGAYAVLGGLLPMQQSIKDIESAQNEDRRSDAFSAQDDLIDQRSTALTYGIINGGAALLGAGLAAGAVLLFDDAESSETLAAPQDK